MKIMRHGFDIPISSCAPSCDESRFFLPTQNTKPLSFIRAGTGNMPPRVLASGPKPCGGKKAQKDATVASGIIFILKFDKNCTAF